MKLATPLQEQLAFFPAEKEGNFFCPSVFVLSEVTLYLFHSWASQKNPENWESIFLIVIFQVRRLGKQRVEGLLEAMAEVAWFPSPQKMRVIQGCSFLLYIHTLDVFTVFILYHCLPIGNKSPTSPFSLLDTLTHTLTFTHAHLTPIVKNLGLFICEKSPESTFPDVSFRM